MSRQNKVAAELRPATLAQKQLIGAILEDPDRFPLCLEAGLTKEHFDDMHVSDAWLAAVQLYNAGDTISVVSVVDIIGRDEDVLLSYVADCPRKVDVFALARSIINDKTRDKLTHELQQSLVLAESKHVSPDVVAAEADAKISKIMRESVVRRRSTESDEALVFRAYSDMLSSKTRISGISTGYGSLDAMIGGLKAGRLIVIAARPSIGKTALGLNIASHISINNPVLFVSIEMTKEELTQRSLSAIGRFDGKVFEQGVLPSLRTVSRMGYAYCESLNRNMIIDDSASMTISQICSSIRIAKDREGIKCAFVDYLQLVSPDGRGMSRQETVAEMSKRFKDLSKSLKIPIVLLAQLNRVSDQTADKRPELHHLRESGAIEQDADTVILIHRPDFYDPTERPGRADLIVAKNRGGATGVVEVGYNAPWTRFLSLAYDAA